MTLFTKINGLKALLSVLGMLLLFHFFLTFMDYKSDHLSSINKLSIRKVNKFAIAVANHSSNTLLPIAPLTYFKERSNRNKSVIPDDDDDSSSMYLGRLRKLEDSNRLHPPKTTRTTISRDSHRIGKLESLPVPQKSSLPECSDPDPLEGGPISPNATLVSLDIIEAELGPLLKPGGYFEPKDCKPKHHVAIVVPFRDRYAHLSVFLRNIHPFLMKQNITYRIFIVEQTNGRPFNRAAMMNIGFLEALKMYPWDCFIFHDVDLLPLDSRNIYNCPRQPRHMSVAIDVLNFKLPYRSIFGGVSAMTRKQFETVNGFSNSFFGWGGEDDDMSNRLKHANFFISRYPINISRYKMLKHQKEKANPLRYENLVNGISKMEMDGINSIKYDIYNIREFPTFTWYLAELKISDRKS